MTYNNINNRSVDKFFVISVRNTQPSTTNLYTYLFFTLILSLIFSYTFIIIIIVIYRYNIYRLISDIDTYYSNIVSIIIIIKNYINVL